MYRAGLPQAVAGRTWELSLLFLLQKWVKLWKNRRLLQSIYLSLSVIACRQHIAHRLRVKKTANRIWFVLVKKDDMVMTSATRRMIVASYLLGETVSHLQLLRNKVIWEDSHTAFVDDDVTWPLDIGSSTQFCDLPIRLSDARRAHRKSIAFGKSWGATNEDE